MSTRANRLPLIQSVSRTHELRRQMVKFSTPANVTQPKYGSINPAATSSAIHMDNSVQHVPWLDTRPLSYATARQHDISTLRTMRNSLYETNLCWDGYGGETT